MNKFRWILWAFALSGTAILILLSLFISNTLS